MRLSVVSYSYYAWVTARDEERPEPLTGSFGEVLLQHSVTLQKVGCGAESLLIVQLRCILMHAGNHYPLCLLVKATTVMADRTWQLERKSIKTFTKKAARGS